MGMDGEGDSKESVPLAGLDDDNDEVFVQMAKNSINR